MMQDLRFALRMARKNPGTTFASFLALTLGIGATTAIFSVVSGVLLRPLPVKDSAKLVRIFSTDSSTNENDVCMSDYLDWREHLKSFSDLSLYRIGQSPLTGLGLPERVLTGEAEWTLLPTLGIVPLQGRNFRAEENYPGRGNEVILGWSFWQKHFTGQNAIGKTINLDEKPYTVIGVLPRDFTVVANRVPDIWLPLPFDLTEQRNMRGYHNYQVLGRLTGNASLAQANAELGAYSSALSRAYPDENKGISARAVEAAEALNGAVKPALLMLLGAVICVLLIACGNAANVALARGWSRQKEIAIRVAAGASRARLFRQVLTESVVLSSAAALCGLILTAAAIQVFEKLPPATLPRLSEIGIDWRVLCFAAAAALLTGLTFGLIPALRAGTVNLALSLRQSDGRSTESKKSQRWQRTFVAIQATLATLLLIESGLLARSFVAALRIDPGLRVEHLLTMHLSLPISRYNGDHLWAAPRFIEQAVEQIRTIPGVKSVAAVSDLPLTGTGGGGEILVEGQRPKSSAGEAPFVYMNVVSSGYFHTVGIPFICGKDFSSFGTPGKVTTIVNQALVRKFFAGRNPLGKRIASLSTQPNWLEITGVVADVPQLGIEKEALPEMYFPIAPVNLAWWALVLRVEGDPARYTRAIQTAIGKADPSVAVFLPMTMQQIIDGQLTWRGLQASILGFFAFLAIALASLGIYAAIAYSVNMRTSEIGIRMALGASGRKTLMTTLWQGALPALAGIGAGTICSFALARLTQQLFFRVEANDALTYLVVLTLLAVVSAAASYFPARRAAALDPWAALKEG